MIGSIIGGGLSLIGGILGNKSNRDEASNNRDFQERMSREAHQREVEDLRKAGLNPVLSANHGASSPQGSVAPQRDAVTPALQSAVQIAQLKNETALRQAQEQLLKSQSVSTAVDANIKNEQLKRDTVLTNVLDEKLQRAQQSSKVNLTGIGYSALNEGVKYLNDSIKSSSRQVSVPSSGVGFIRNLIQKGREAHKRKFPDVYK